MTGETATEIARVAVESQADLIVVGVRGDRMLAQRIFGSTATRLIRRAGCPVLTVPIAPTRRQAPPPEGDSDRRLAA